MKRTILIAILAVTAACGAKKDKAGDGSGSATVVAVGSGSAAVVAVGSGSAVVVAVGSGSAATPATGSGSAAAPSTGSGSAAAPATGSGAAKAEPAKGSAVDVPSVADYEAKAKAEVTDKNVDAQLKDLEKDLGN